MSRSPLLASAAVTLLVLVAGCAAAPTAAPTAGPADDRADEPTPTLSGTPSGALTTASSATRTVDRASGDERDVVGWEGGYWHDDPLDVNQSDGLSEAELDAYLARTMARVEYLRGHEFTRPVTVEVVTREELRRRIEETGSFASETRLSADRVRIMNGFWEALFFVGEDRDVVEVRAGEASSFLGAYYLFGTDTIRVVTDDPDRIVVDERLLVHELLHALQDEYGDTPLDTQSDDDSYATTALVEGDAMVVEYRYAERCRSGAWDCLVPPAISGGGSSGDVHRGFRTLRQFAYSDGPVFVQHLYENGGVDGTHGWAAVDAAYEIRPRTTEEVIHPERYPTAVPSRPRSTSFTPRDGWTRLGGPYTVGEVEVFGMFWYQTVGYDIPVVDADDFSNPDGGQYDRFNYTSAPSTGWDGDWLTIVERGDETGYVWTTRWDSTRDAREFHGAYLRVLEGHGAQPVGDRTWVVPDGEYADAFYVDREGRRVTVVNAPTVEDLSDVYPGPG